MKFKSLEHARTAHHLADTLETMARAARSGQLPHWLVLNIAPSVAMVAHVVHSYLAAAVAARPIPR
jgi:hypothetical protein